MAEQAFHLDASWDAVDFISDLHLSEGLPKTFAAWEHFLICTRANAVFILGDLFEVWVGDDMRSLAFEARCIDVLAAAAAKRPIWVQHGNRDFLLGEAFATAAGVRLLADPTALTGFGHTALLTHGDALCIDDVPYQLFREQVRSHTWQEQLLAQSLEARLGIAAKMRAASRATRDEPVTFADADPRLAQAWLKKAGAHILIHGHTHRPGSEQNDGWTRHVLSDWDLDTATPEQQRAEVLRWNIQGFERLTPATACV